MTVDTALYPAALNTTIPTASDFVSEGDDNFRQVKTCLKTTFSNVNGALTATHTEFNYITGVTSGIQAQLTAKAPAASPTFTGTVVLPATTSIGTVSDAEIAHLDGVTSPIQTQLNAKGAIAGQAWTGAHSFAGSITVPTMTAGDSSTNAASTAYVVGTAFSAALPGQSGNAGKFVQTDGSAASWAWPVLAINLISTTSTAVAGKLNVITAGGITVTLPTLAAGIPCGVINASNTTTPIVDWGTTKFRGQISPGLMTLDNKSASLFLVGTGDANLGNI